jgi:RHS repeat-associated protein
VVDPTGGVTRYSYDAIGNLIQTQFPNGVTEIRQYNDLNQLEYLETSKLDGEGNKEILTSYTYTLDKVGNRVSVTDRTGRVTEYDYDDLYRLEQEKVTADGVVHTIDFTYDNVGNRLSQIDSTKGTTTYVYDDNDRLLTETLNQVDGNTVITSYDYDNNGNTIAKTVDNQQTTYTWNDENRLVEVETPDGRAIDYQYDTTGIRVSSTVGGVTTQYLIDSNRDYAQVLEEYVDGVRSVSYVYGRDLISQERSSGTSFYLVDGLGSTTALANVNGNVTDTYSYEAFGELEGQSGSTENSYLFTGEQFDQNLGEYYLRQRYYDTETGRFTRRDVYEGSIDRPITSHRYLYSWGNPANWQDPSGLTPNYGELLQAINIASIIINISQAFHNGYRAITAPTEEEAFEASVQAGFNVFGALLGISGGGFIGGGPSLSMSGGALAIPAVVSSGPIVAGVAIPVSQSILSIIAGSAGGFGSSVSINREDHVNVPKHCLDDLAPSWSQQKDLLIKATELVIGNVQGTIRPGGEFFSFSTYITSTSGNLVPTEIRGFRYNDGTVKINTAFVPEALCSHPLP